jgi:FixJ family two-component response regulator
MPVGGSGPLLLVVDDEDGVRRTVTRMLERTGYRIVGASDGREGLAVLQRLAAEGTTVHGVVTDVRMPQLGGVEMVAAMMARGWYLPVLFVSGQLDAPLPDHWPTTVSRRFLRKPFTLTELQTEVTALLNTSPVADGGPAA